MQHIQRLIVDKNGYLIPSPEIVSELNIVVTLIETLRFGSTLYIIAETPSGDFVCFVSNVAFNKQNSLIEVGAAPEVPSIYETLMATGERDNCSSGVAIIHNSCLTIGSGGIWKQYRLKWEIPGFTSGVMPIINTKSYNTAEKVAKVVEYIHSVCVEMSNILIKAAEESISQLHEVYRTIELPRAIPINISSILSAYDASRRGREFRFCIENIC